MVEETCKKALVLSELFTNFKEMFSVESEYQRHVIMKTRSNFSCLIFNNYRLIEDIPVLTKPACLLLGPSPALAHLFTFIFEGIYFKIVERDK